MRHFECHYWWTLWDGFQTLPRRSNTRLTRENVTLPHPDGRPPRARSGPPTRPKRTIWKKSDSFQTLCSGGCARSVVDELVHLYEEGVSIDELARRYGVHRTTIIAQLDRRDVPRRRVARKMTDALVARASERYAGRLFTRRRRRGVQGPCTYARPGVSAGWDAHQRASRLDSLKPSQPTLRPRRGATPSQCPDRRGGQRSDLRIVIPISTVWSVMHGSSP